MGVLDWLLLAAVLGLAVLALLPIWMYNGRRGPGGRGFQYFCYAFYPVHILILAVLWIYIL